MSYNDNIEGRRSQEIGFYFEFSGIKSRLSTHNFNDDLDGEFIEAVDFDSISEISNSLNRQLSFVQPSGCTFLVNDSPEIRNYFLRRGGVEKSLTADFDSFSTFIDVADMGLSIGDFLYVNQETCTIDSVYGSGGYTVTRASSNSFVANHRQGTIVSDRPRHWLNRNCKMYAVDLVSYASTVFGSFFLSDSPKFTDGRWSIQLVDLLSKLNAPCFKGWKEQESVSIAAGGDYIVGTGEQNSNIVDIELPDVNEIVLNSDNRGHVKVEFDDYWGVFTVLGSTALDVSSDTLSLAFSHVVSHNFGDSFSKSTFKDKLIDSEKAAVSLIFFFDGQLNYLANLLLHSRIGDGLNGYYDKLAGRDRQYNSGAFDSSEKRIGAGIDQSLIDPVSFLYCSNDRVTLYIDSEIQLIDIFADEILWRSGGYLYVNNSGQIAFKRYSPLTVRHDALTIDDSVNLQVTSNSIDDENTQISRAVFECNYNPKFGFLKQVEIIFVDDEGIYGDNRAELSFKSRGVWVGGISGGMQNIAVTNFLQIQIYLERVKQRQVTSSHRIHLKLPWQMHTQVPIGKKLKVTDSTMPSHVDSGSLSEVYFEVVGEQYQNEEGTVVVELESVAIGVLVVPSFEVASYDAGDNEITINTGGNLGSGVLFDSNPAMDFAADWKVRIYRAAASPPFSTHEDNLVYAVTGDFMELRNTPIINPAAGDIVTIVNGEDTSNLNDINADIQDFAFGADSNLEVGSGAYLRDGSRWG